MTPDDAYADKTIAEVIFDYLMVRGDLTDGRAREQLVTILENRERRMQSAAWREGWDRAMASVFVAKLPNRSPEKDNPYN